MFDRMSCMENSEENADKLIKAVERMEPLESTESSNISLVSTCIFIQSCVEQLAHEKPLESDYPVKKKVFLLDHYADLGQIWKKNG